MKCLKCENSPQMTERMDVTGAPVHICPLCHAHIPPAHRPLAHDGAEADTMALDLPDVASTTTPTADLTASPDIPVSDLWRQWMESDGGDTILLDAIMARLASLYPRDPETTWHMTRRAINRWRGQCADVYSALDAGDPDVLTSTIVTCIVTMGDLLGDLHKSMRED